MTNPPYTRFDYSSLPSAHHNAETGTANSLLTKRDDPVMVVQDHAEREAIPGRAGEPLHAGEVPGRDRRRRLHFDAHDPSVSILDDDVDLIALLVAEMGEPVAVVGPPGELQDFSEDEGLEQRPERRPVPPQTVWREVA